MRRMLLICALALALTAALSSCAGARRPYRPEDVETLLSSGAFSGEMARVEGALPALYGVEAGELEVFVSYRAVNTAMSCDEVTVLVLTDEEAAKRAEAACRRAIESELAGARVYTPGAVPSLEAAVVDRSGRTVLVAVGDPETLPDALDGLNG